MSQKFKEHDANELIQYYIVNKDLEMSKGKIASQVAHASMVIALRDQNDEKFKQWKNSIMKKIILMAHEKDLLKLKDKVEGSILIVDKGFTEIEPNSNTVLGLPVMTRLEAEPYVKRLQLCK